MTLKEFVKTKKFVIIAALLCILLLLLASWLVAGNVVKDEKTPAIPDNSFYSE